jgi:HPt (histidine-containing phosphotransfer) domain-containing protein
METDPPAIDAKAFEQIRELEQSGSPGFVAELAAVFLRQGEEQLAILRGCRRSGDDPGLIRSAHLLKGSSGGIGALPMMQICRTLEEAARGEDWHAVGPLLDRLEREFARVREALRAAAGTPSDP